MADVHKTLQATDEVNELENNEGECPPNPDPLKTSVPVTETAPPCGECVKAKVDCEGQPGESCEQCKVTRQKCSRALRVGRKVSTSCS